MPIINRNKKAEWEGIRGSQGPIREDQIFPYCFFIPENFPILLFISPFCFFILEGFPLLLFYLPILLYYASRLLFYFSYYAFLFQTNALIVRRFCATLLSYIIIYIYYENYGLPAFMQGGHPEPGG